jgi:hypothetical protein
MTSDVKKWQQLFRGFQDGFVLGASENPEPVKPTVDPAALRGLVTT